MGAPVRVPMIPLYLLYYKRPIYIPYVCPLYSLTIQINSGLDRMLRETLESRPEVAETELDMTFNYVTVVCHPGFCSNTCFSFSAQEENPSGGPGPQLQM